MVVRPSGGGRPCEFFPLTVERRACEDLFDCPRDCVVGWSEWGECSSNCIDSAAGGVRPHRTSRKVVESLAAFGGQDCQGEGEERREECAWLPYCPVDCAVGYLEWSACSKSCGNGTRAREWGVLVTAKYGGKECQGKGDGDGKGDGGSSMVGTNATNHPAIVEACNTQECDADCLYGWSEWSECPCGVDAEAVMSRRTFTVLEPQTGEGVCEPHSQMGRAEEYPCGPSKPCPVNSCRGVCGLPPAGDRRCDCSLTCLTSDTCCEDYVASVCPVPTAAPTPINACVSVATDPCRTAAGTRNACIDNSTDSQSPAYVCVCREPYYRQGPAQQSCEYSPPLNTQSCRGRCGVAGGYCSCSLECLSFGDCCLDYSYYCAAFVQPSTNECDGKCGDGSVAGVGGWCSCADDCITRDADSQPGLHCCPSFARVCLSKCYPNTCNAHLAGCTCARDCVVYGDCCEGVLECYPDLV